MLLAAAADAQEPDADVAVGALHPGVAGGRQGHRRAGDRGRLHEPAAGGLRHVWTPKEGR